MHKKGFTLIELLAVIVILAIIALITMPMITGIVAKAKKGGAESSALGWIDAVEKQVMLNQLNSKNEIDLNETYSVLELKDKGVKVKGQSPNSGYMSLEEGKIAHADLCIGEYRVIIENDKIVDTVKDNDCKLELEPGLYDKNNNLVLSWEELESKYNFDVEIEYGDLELGNGQLVSVLKQWSNDTKKDYKLIKKIVIPFGKYRIGRNAFKDCDFLSSVIIPSSIVEIGWSSFSGCSNLTSIIIPFGVKKIDAWAFDECINLKSIILPNSITRLRCAFQNCKSLKSIIIPEFVSKIEGQTFQNCINLKSVVISNGVREIDYNAFLDCTSLTSIVIPSGVSIIRGAAFDGCINLKKIDVDKNNKFYTSVDGVLYNKNNTKIVVFPKGRKGSFLIPSSVTEIDYSAFEDSIGLTSITIPSGVKSLSNYMFSGCLNLENIEVDKNNSKYKSMDDVVYDKNKTEIIIFPKGKKGSFTIPSGVTRINSGIFANCKGLTNVVIPNSVTEIESAAFEDCIGLTSVMIPSSVSGLNLSAFDGCTNLIRIEVDENNSRFSSVDGILYDKNKKILYRCPNGRKGSIVISSGTTEIYSMAFENCKKITSVVIPLGISKISWSSFANCTNLTNITIPSSVTLIESYAFNNCISLTNITIPSGVTEIDDSAFKDCKGLTNVVLPNTIIKIGSFAFENCISLTNITIPSSVTEIEYYVFENCTKLNNVVFENKSGWYVVEKDYGDKVLSRNAIDVNDSLVNANNLKNTYLRYYWER